MYKVNIKDYQHIKYIHLKDYQYDSKDFWGKMDTSISLKRRYIKKIIISASNNSIQLHLLVFEYLKTVDNQSVITYYNISAYH